MNGDPLDELDEQGAEIKRLVAENERLRLTDAEREAIAWCRDNLTAMAHPASAFAYIYAATLGGLLERLG